MDEDTPDPPGDSLASLFGPGFADPDAGSSLAGVAVVANPDSPHSAEDRLLQQQTVMHLYELLEDLSYLAEAMKRLRDEAAQRWPDLRIGPHLLWSDPDFLVGLMAASGLPWPGSLDGRIAAASTSARFAAAG